MSNRHTLSLSASRRAAGREIHWDFHDRSPHTYPHGDSRNTCRGSSDCRDPLKTTERSGALACCNGRPAVLIFDRDSDDVAAVVSAPPRCLQSFTPCLQSFTLAG